MDADQQRAGRRVIYRPETSWVVFALSTTALLLCGVLPEMRKAIFGQAVLAWVLAMSFV